MNRYRPTPAALDRDARALIGVLAIALRNVDQLNYPAADGEESSAGNCWMRHPITGRFMAGDCERDCLEHCARLCGAW